MNGPVNTVIIAMPGFLRTHYLQYKRETAQLSSWLAQTAVSLGYPLGSFTPHGDTPQPRSAAQKRNARKKARVKAKKLAQKASAQEVDNVGHEQTGKDAEGGTKVEGEDNNAKAPPLAGDYILKIGQFADLARYVADKLPAIPAEVSHILRRCIHLRNKSAHRFSPASDPANDTHRHFIQVLEEVLAIFSASQRPDNVASESIGDASNRFAILQTDDQEAEDLPDIELPGVSDHEGLQFNVEMSLGEAVSAVVMFFEDVETIRQHIDKLWRDYKHGDVDLVTASVTTNTALELLRGPHDDLMRVVLPVFDHNREKMIWFTFVAMQGYTRGLPAFDMPDFEHLPHSDHVRSGLYDFLHIPLIQIMNGQVDLLDGDGVPAYRAGAFGVWDPAANHAKFTPRERWVGYEVLLAEGFSDLFALLALGSRDRSLGARLQDAKAHADHNNAFFVSEHVRAMAHFFQTKEWDFMTMIGCQAYLDINFALGDTTVKGEKELRTVAGRMYEALDRRRGIEGPDLPQNWDANNETIAGILRIETKYWRDFDLKHIARFVPIMRGTGGRFVERHPMLCGLLLFRLYIRYHDFGLALANTW